MTTPETATSAKASLKLWLNRLGSALGILGVLFVAERLYTYREELAFDGWSGLQFTALAGLCIAYAATNLSLALGWHALLSYLKAPQPILWSIRIYAVTQLAKYLPGNIFQFAGRQALGAAAGVPQWVLLKSSFWEIVLLACAAASLAPILAYTVLPLSENASQVAFAAGVALLVLVAFLVLPRAFAKAAAAYASQVVGSGVIFVGVFALAGGEMHSAAGVLTVIASFSLSWLAGFLTPGAPAGLGVREAALIYFLGDLAVPAVIIAAAVLGRVVSTLGDLLFFGAGRFIKAT